MSVLGRWVIVALLAALPLIARAEIGAPSEAYPHPIVPAEARWPGALLMSTFFLFFAAAFVGVVVIRNQAADELPPTQSHDEPPGASRHHGPRGLRP